MTKVTKLPFSTFNFEFVTNKNKARFTSQAHMHRCSKIKDSLNSVIVEQKITTNKLVTTLQYIINYQKNNANSSKTETSLYNCSQTASKRPTVKARLCQHGVSVKFSVDVLTLKTDYHTYVHHIYL